MKLPIFQVDAFTNELFKGNPAAVVPLEEWLNDATMQSIALENNLSETAFFVPTQAGFEIRWFTPVTEVNLCGHATLATAHVIFNEADYPRDTIEFGSRSGKLIVKKLDEYLQLNFPADEIIKIDEPTSIIKGLGKHPAACYKGKNDMLFLFNSEEDILNINPEFHLLANSEERGIIVTAPGHNVDFVSRFFAPQVGINEDPVTGSAHTTLAPFWSSKLRKTKLTAKQLSQRGGELICTLKGDRILIAGKAKTYLRGEIFI